MHYYRVIRCRRQALLSKTTKAIFWSAGDSFEASSAAEVIPQVKMTMMTMIMSGGGGGGGQDASCCNRRRSSVLDLLLMEPRRRSNVPSASNTGCRKNEEANAVAPLTKVSCTQTHRPLYIEIYIAPSGNLSWASVIAASRGAVGKHGCLLVKTLGL